ncbi:glycoside hydrolase family 26 protein [Pseudobacteriovorax antillogorgiicola]|nr:glycosyl hydrolase [Pseudobacteriovorax antillogorgiicola]
MNEKLRSFITSCIFFMSGSMSIATQLPAKVVDEDASKETLALFQNLRAIAASDQFIFGQEFPTDFSRVGGLNSDVNGSDVKSVVGDHPGLHGSDFHYFLDKSDEEREIHLQAVQAAYSRGAVVTFDWHMTGPDGTSFYVSEKTKDLVPRILGKDPKALPWFLSKLDEMISIVNELGFPIVLRPFHEMNGDWFWWGNHIGNENYIQFYRLFVDYVKPRVNNVLFAWSPNIDPDFTYYPGDNYVDILGIDGYEPGSVSYFSIERMLESLAIITEYAEQKGKLAAFTETGHRNGYPQVDSRFWTEHILKPIVSHPKARGIAWVLTWINSTWSGPYVPHKGLTGTTAYQDFQEFFMHPATIFERDLPPMYQIR